MKRGDESVGGSFPTLRRTGARLECFLIERDQSLEDRAEDVVIDAAAGEVRIERLRLGAVADVEHARAVAERDHGFAFRAGGLREEDEEREGGGEKAEQAQEHATTVAGRMPRGNPRADER